MSTAAEGNSQVAGVRAILEKLQQFDIAEASAARAMANSAIGQPPSAIRSASASLAKLEHNPQPRGERPAPGSAVPTFALGHSRAAGGGGASDASQPWQQRYGGFWLMTAEAIAIAGVAASIFLLMRPDLRHSLQMNQAAVAAPAERQQVRRQIAPPVAASYVPPAPPMVASVETAPEPAPLPRLAAMVPSPPPEAPAVALAVPPAVQPAVLDVAHLVEKANLMLGEGRVVEARTLLQSAAAEGSPDVAWALGRAYDPNVLATVAADAPAEPKEAVHWYRRWHALAVEQGMIPQSVSIDRLIRTLK